MKQKILIALIAVIVTFLLTIWLYPFVKSPQQNIMVSMDTINDTISVDADRRVDSIPEALNVAITPVFLYSQLSDEMKKETDRIDSFDFNKNGKKIIQKSQYGWSVRIIYEFVGDTLVCYGQPDNPSGFEHLRQAIFEVENQRLKVRDRLLINRDIVKINMDYPGNYLYRFNLFNPQILNITPDEVTFDVGIVIPDTDQGVSLIVKFHKNDYSITFDFGEWDDDPVESDSMIQHSEQMNP